MDNGFKDPEQDDLLDLSASSDDASNSSSSVSLKEDSKMVFEGSKPLILELHDMTRTKTKTDKTEPKKKIRRKKRSKDKAKKESSSSPSDASLHLKNVPVAEKFYDAHESYHGIPPPHQQNTKTATPVGALVIEASSGLAADMKAEPEVQQTASAILAATTTAITKPTE